ncbi:quinoprotein dehydrogenase-associated SoxYZ-like carrier (plasmid) [Paroceanicella profunda]|uniref:Quinoprotein dehydrogenase-associated SoxYZ-like carrier n=1 Tax=Paroceanicella profunda TaxID=2579971 RepID=A0A5B8FJ39_9RHOB|nr:quinoprotein dehydrogenase-associated SoxYZ-like carrier [Paroceanicella profunda]QDL93808.1 quinoprotein dehydrogenase-associated SoxYZ-like carrier [Paroceanicella profunda]
MRKHIITLAALAALASPLAAQERASPMQPSESWDSLRTDIIGTAELQDGTGILSLDAPYRAHDAALVPVHVVQTGGARIVKLTLVVDENPAPVVAEFSFGPAMGQVDLETRVRVNEYSNIRVLAETEDGTVYMTGRYVKASGGCAAPAMKDSVAAQNALGQMRLRAFAPEQPGARGLAQVMLRHPNYSGLQRNQVTQLYIPARFVNALEVKQGDATLFTMTGGISISEDPTFRFAYTDNGAPFITIRATDTDGQVFQEAFPAPSFRS